METVTMAPSDEHVTYKEAAERFGVSVETLQNWVSRRLINRYRRELDRKVYVSVREIEALRNAPPKLDPQ